MAKSRRKHRRVKGAPPGWKGCKCPAGSRKVSTCSSLRGKKVCRGRGWGCLGVGPSQKGKPSPRFVAAVCKEPDKKPPRPGRPSLPPPAAAPAGRPLLMSAGDRMPSLLPPPRKSVRR